MAPSQPPHEDNRNNQVVRNFGDEKPVLQV